MTVRTSKQQHPAPGPRKSDAPPVRTSNNNIPPRPRKKTHLLTIMLSKRIGKLLEAAHKSRLRAVAVVVGELELPDDCPIGPGFPQVRLRARVRSVRVRRVRIAYLIVFR